MKGKIEALEDGVVTSKIKFQITAPMTVTAVITKESVNELNLKHRGRGHSDNQIHRFDAGKE